MNRRKFLGVSASALAATTVSATIPETSKPVTEEGLHVRFLGTGAADWNGKDERGEQRRFTSTLLNRHILIDYTKQAQDMIPADCHPDTIFYTHSHGDHYNAKDLLQLGSVKTVYLSQTWYNIALMDFGKAAKELGVDAPQINPICIGQHITVDRISFTPMPANHSTDHQLEQPIIYLIQSGKTRLLYATDTSGLPSIATRLFGYNSHRPEQALTAIIMEATIGLNHPQDNRIFSHSSVELVKNIVDFLTRDGSYTPPTGQLVYLTHLARTLHGTQQELDATLPAPLKAAYDGQEILLK